MAQARVSDYFDRKKRSHETHPSKRRKIDPIELKADVATEVDVKSCINIGSAPLPCVKQSVTTPRTKPRGKGAPTTRRRGVAKKNPVTGQISIQDAFAKASGSSSDTDGHEALRDAEQNEVTEVVTSYWDEHDGHRTPKRKTRPVDSMDAPLSDCRENKSARRSKLTARKSTNDQVTPKKDGTWEKEKAARGRTLGQSFRKMLAEKSPEDSPDLSQKATEKDVVPILEPSSPSSKINANLVPPDSQPLDSMKPVVMPSDEELAAFFKPVHPVPISPLPPAPQEPCKKPSKLAAISPGVKSSMEKLKELQKEDGTSDRTIQKTVGGKSTKKIIPPEKMRERLAKCGKLDTLKAKLAEMNSSLKAVRKRQAEKMKADTDVAEVDLGPLEKTTTKPETATSTVEAEKKAVPAYERYEHLAREGPPSLALPGKYQRLLTMFQGTDTVVSMLFNRQEVITFSKLQTAVQSMTRKNFDQQTLGQMKTVYPDAYTFRQEKGLARFGHKVSNYQLTVEPVLEGLDKEGPSTGKNEKATMSAQALLKRKRIFHNSLFSITKDHHANFLSKQIPPIQIPSSKMTRWHPRFPLDSVPDIEKAELPEPPIQKVQTAKQVLDCAMGKLPARVEAALAKVAAQSESTHPKASTTGEPSKATVSAPSTPKPADSPYRGIPLSLLEKIRAKEAAKTKAALTRDPKEDKKTEMIGRLPTLIRSLRTFYVTEKKPSLPYKTVVDKLVDSYDTFISPVEVEAHLALLHELAPKWMQVIQIARGKYIKIDKNMDISTIITELNNLAKSRS
ncbi:DNA replication factor Cdt1-like isoform X2 [Babylonia areolata]|uniref:DNA replication factor Cdt1-like isoform X2 n=1 Tax=Babylonia areolata TaxID=304850 RepID=UPI003FD2DDEA